jgi:hypothetical protein
MEHQPEPAERMADDVERPVPRRPRGGVERGVLIERQPVAHRGAGAAGPERKPAIAVIVEQHPRLRVAGEPLRERRVEAGGRGGGGMQDHGQARLRRRQPARDEPRPITRRQRRLVDFDHI